MKKTILFLDHTARLGGGEIALLNLVRELNPEEFHPVVVLGANGPLRERLCEAGIETHVMPLSSAVGEARKDSLGFGSLLRVCALLHLVTYSWKLAAFIKIRQVDLLHTNSLKADVLGAISARLARVPVVWHVRDRIDRDYLPGPVARVFRWLCRILPDHVIANSAATLRTLGIGARRNQGVVHDGVPGAWSPQPCPLSEPPVVGLVGRIAPWKGQDVFIRAAYLVRQRLPQVRFQIIGSAMFGEGDYERGIHALVNDLKLSDAIEFTGFLDDTRAAIGQLSILVHASRTGEPFGQVVIEGMAMGKPVVATNGGGIPEIVEDRRTGLLVAMGDPNEMADAIIWLIGNAARARKMGEAGRERIGKHFTISQTARKIERVYGELIEANQYECQH